MGIRDSPMPRRKAAGRGFVAAAAARCGAGAIQNRRDSGAADCDVVSAAGELG